MAHGVSARWLADGSTTLLWFDARDLLVAAEGEIALPPVGAAACARSSATSATSEAYTLPFSGRYLLDGRPLMDETIRQWVPADPELTPAWFATGP